MDNDWPTIGQRLANAFKKGIRMKEKTQVWIVSGQPAPKIEDVAVPKKPRLSWMRELTGRELIQFLQKMHYSSGCHYCIYRNNAEGMHPLEQCKKGNASWWNELVTLDQFLQDAVWDN